VVLHLKTIVASGIRSANAGMELQAKKIIEMGDFVTIGFWLFIMKDTFSDI